MKLHRLCYLILLAFACTQSQVTEFESIDPKIYVANEESGDVTVIDEMTGTVIRTIPVGEQPVDLVFHEGQNELYVANALSRSITIIDAVVDTVLETINFERPPIALAVGNGDSLFILARTGTSIESSIYILDIKNHIIADSINLPATCWVHRDITLGPNSKLYSTGVLGPFWFVLPFRPLILDLSTRQVQEDNTIEANVLALSPDKTTIYLLGRAGRVRFYNISQDKLTWMRVGVNLTSIVFSPVASEAYVVEADSNEIFVVDTINETINRKFSIADKPSSLAISGKGDFLYLSHPLSNSISVLDTAGGFLQEISVGIKPGAIVRVSFD